MKVILRTLLLTLNVLLVVFSFRTNFALEQYDKKIDQVLNIAENSLLAKAEIKVKKVSKKKASAKD